MRIWVIGRSYPTKQNKMRGSFELEQAKLIASYGHDVSYIAAIFHPINKVKKWGYLHFDDGNVAVYTESLFYAPERMHLHLRFFQMKVWKCLLSKVEKERNLPDIIHIHYPGMVSIPEAILAYQKRGVKVVVTDHWSKTLMNTMDSFQRMQLITYANRADAVLCVGHPLREAIMKITCTKKNVQVIPNMVSPIFKPNLQEKQKGIYNFISVGRLESVKQIDMVVAAFAKGFAGKEDIQLTIVGDGKERGRIEKIIEKCQVKNQVHLTGVLSREETAKKVASSDALICFSRLETFGVPVIEAWACGKPVIASDGLGFLEYWNDELGYVVHHNDVEGLCESMEKIYLNRVKYDSKIIAQFAEDNFGEKAVYEKLQDVYLSIVRTKEV